jgi:hypothetical protein
MRVPICRDYLICLPARQPIAARNGNHPTLLSTLSSSRSLSTRFRKPNK